MKNETNNNGAPSKLTSTAKSATVRIFLAAGLVLVGGVAASALTDPLDELRSVEEEYKARVEKRDQAAEYYNIAHNAWCEARIDLAEVKLKLYYSGDLDMEKAEMARIANLIEKGCNPDGEAPGLIQDL